MGKKFYPFTTSYSIKIKGNMAYRSYVIVNSDIETMIIYVIINLFSETDVFFFGMACKSLFHNNL